MYSYVALVWDPQDADAGSTAHSFSRSIAGSDGWSIAYQGQGLIVAHTRSRQGSARAYVLPADSGVVLGTLFHRAFSDSVGRATTTAVERDAERIVASGGEFLVDHYWGAYVAFLHDARSGTHYVFREPLNNPSCYRTSHNNVHCFFSNVADALRFIPLRLAVNRDYLIRWLVVGRLIARDCALAGVEDMTGGERISFHRGKVERTLLWNPIKIATDRTIEDVNDAVDQLRDSVQGSVNAWAACYRRIAHKLSGGLDSSIVAGCLAKAPTKPALSFLHFSINEGVENEQLHLPGVEHRTAAKARAIAASGDERYFARLVANRCCVPLQECERTLALDLRRMWQAPLAASPSAYFSCMELDDAEIQLVREQSTQAFFSGQGGDTIFFATTQPLAAIDFAFTRGLHRDLWTHILATSMLSQESVWEVCGKTIKHGLARRPYTPPFSVLDPPNLLTDAARATLREEHFNGAWSPLAGNLPPGKQNLVDGITGNTFHDFVFFSGDCADHIDPLNSQPVWEVVLQIPTYHLLAGGQSRGLARRAFADLLPAEIPRRQMKGTGTPFYQQVVRRNRGHFRELLLDGRLVEGGYLDRLQLAKYLEADEPFMRVGAMDLLCYLAAEVWMRQLEEPVVSAFRLESPISHRVDAAPATAHIGCASPARDPRGLAARSGTSPRYDA